MKHFDENVSDEVRTVRNDFINMRWKQLYSLAEDSGESALKYLFSTNSGGAVAVLAYLGSISSKGGTAPLSAKISLVSFFIGILFVGLHKAYMVHRFEGLFSHYQGQVEKYYDGKIGWGALTESDATKVGKPITPYILGYASFFCFIAGCFAGAYGVL